MTADFSFLKRTPARIVTGLLLAQSALYYGKARGVEQVPLTRPLAEFPQTAGSWTMFKEYPLEDKILEILKADDTLSRGYKRPGSPEVHLFIGYFKSQRQGQRPHSPQNCLPGSGWESAHQGRALVQVAGRAEPIEINRYLVKRGSARSMVLYWYQSRERVVASEYAAQAWSVVDAIRLNRSDTAIVKIVTPADGMEEREAEELGLGLVRDIFPHLEKYFPK